MTSNLRWLVTAWAAAALLATGIAVGAETSRHHEPSFDRSSRSGRAVLQRADRLEHARQAHRDSAAGRRERARSRSAYRDQSRAESHRTARAEFPELVGPWAARWPALGRREHLKRYLSDNAAVMETAGGRRAVVESIVPLRGREPDGDRARVDLALTRVGRSLAPKSSSTRVRLPLDLGAALRFPDRGFGVRLAGARESRAALTYGKAFYANALEDTDLVLQAAPLGAEASLILRSPASPTRPALSFDLSPGQRLRLVTVNGMTTGEAEIVAGGERVATIGPALAVDAQGEGVDVAYEVRGSRLVLAVDTSGDVAYPVAVDPVIYEKNSYGQPLPPSPGASWWNWGIRTNNPVGSCANDASYTFWACAIGDATIWVASYYWQVYNRDDFAAWATWARPGAYIFRFDTDGLFHEENSIDSTAFNGICNAACDTWMAGTWADPSHNTGPWAANDFDSTVAWQIRYYCVNGQAPPVGACTGNGPQDNSAALGNAAQFGFVFRAWGATTAGRPAAWIHGAAVYKSDNSPPRVKGITHEVPVPTGWVESYSETAHIHAFDNGTTGLGPNREGMGMGEVFLSGGGSVQSRRTCGLENNWEGGCPADWTAGIPYTAPEGGTTFTASAKDIIENESPAVDEKTWETKVDQSPPTDYTTERDRWIKEGNPHQKGASVSDVFSGVRDSNIWVAPASDGFDRAASSGWGTAAQGGAWTVDAGPASDFSVASSNGRIALPAGEGRRSASLYGRQIKNVDVSARVRFAQPTPDGKLASVAYLTLRGQPAGLSGYRIGLAPTHDGRLLVLGRNGAGGELFRDENTGLGFVAGAWYRLRAVAITEAAGTSSTIYVKYWRDGEREPGTWRFSTTDTAGPHLAGAAGVRVDNLSIAAPGQEFSYDDVKVLDRDATQGKTAPKSPSDSSPCDAASGCPTLLSHPYTVNTATFAEGPIELVAVASGPLFNKPGTDADLHRRWDGWQVKLDRTVPSIESAPPSTPPHPNVRPGETYTFDVDTSDARSGVEKIDLYVNGGSAPVQTQPGDNCSPTGCDTNPPPKSFSWTVPADYPGASATLKIIVTDKVGHPSLAHQWKVHVDDDSPSASAIGGSLRSARNKAVRGTSLSVHVEAEDGTTAAPSSGVRQVKLFAGRGLGSLSERLAGPVQDCPLGNCRQTWDTTFSPVASDESRTPRRFRVRVADQAGNASDDPPAHPARVSRWRLNETSGTQARDSRGSNHGTYTGGYTLGQGGASAHGDKAVRLDGSSGLVNVGNPANLQLSSGTIEAWVKAPSPGAGYRGIVTKQWAYGLFLRDGVLVTYDWSTFQVRSTGVNLADGEWHHVGLTFRSGVANGTVVYVDGKPRLTTQISVSSQVVGLQIGAGGDAANQQLAGTVDEAAVYSSALGAAEVARLHSAEPDDWRIAHWRLNETAGTAARDANGSNHGTYTGGHTLGRDGATSDGDKAVELNGTTGHVDLPFVHNPSGAFSIEARVRLDSVAGEPTIVAQRDGTGTGRALLLIQGPTNTFASDLGGTRRDSGVVAQPGRFYHVAFTYAGGAGAPWAFYVDGVRTATGTATGESATGGWLLGANKALTSTTFWDGLLDDVAVYPGALSADEVARLHREHVYDWQVVFDNGVPTLDPPEPAADTVWHGGSESVDVKLTGHDTISGVKQFKLFTPKAGGGEDVQTQSDPDCSDAITRLCPTDPPPKTLTYSTAGMPEGADNTVRALAEDTVGNASAARTWKVKVDRSGPSIDSVTGPLSVGDGWIAPGQAFSLAVDVSDPRSGVRKVQLWINDALEQERLLDCETSCPLDPAPQTLTWSVPSGYAPSTAKVEVRAIDGVDNRNSPPRVWNVRVDRHPPGEPELTGTLRDARDKAVNASQLGLRVRATDGTVLAPSSGVRRIKLLVAPESREPVEGGADERGASPAQGCAPENCEQIHDFSFAPLASDESREPRQIVVQVEDQVGNTARHRWKVILDREKPSAGGLALDSPPSTWHDGSSAVSVTVPGADAISGVRLFRLFVPRDDGGDDAPTYDAGCGNTIPPACATSGSHQFSAPLTEVPEGAGNTLRATVDDAAGNTSDPSTARVNVDRSPPTIAVSGPLKEREGQQLPEGTHELHVDARDGSSSGPDAARRSGVRSVEIRVNGVQADYVEQECAADSCGLPRSWTFATDRYAPGEHVVEVIATDQLGHEDRHKVFARTRCCLGESTIWGTSPPGAEAVFGDVDGDAVADAVFRQRATGDLSVAASTGQGFRAPQSWGRWLDPLVEIALGDVTGDGLNDLVGRNGLTGAVQVARSNAASFGTPETWGTWPPTAPLELADVEGDGAVDLAGRDALTGQILIARSTGSGFDPPETHGLLADGHDVRFADVDGDDTADLVVRDRGSHEVTVALSTGPSFDPATTWGSLSSDYDLLLEDVHGDLRFDIVGSDPDTGQVSGASSIDDAFKAAEGWGSFPTGNDLALADVDGDGGADLIGRARLSGELSVASLWSEAPAELLTDADVAPPDDLDDDLMDGDGLDSRASIAAASSRPRKRMALGFQDTGLEGHYPYPGNGDPIYHRMKQLGAGIVRFNVYRGAHENRPGYTENGEPVPFSFGKLGEAIDRAHSNGYRVYLTLTGARAGVDYCREDLNPNSISCQQGYAGTHQGNDRTKFIADYVRFVRAAVAFGLSRGVSTYSIWNEPNLPGGSFLRGTDDEEAEHIVTAHLYRELYVAASKAIWEMDTSAKVIMGELSGGGNKGARISEDDPPSHIDALEYLRAVVKGPSGSGSLVTDGVALHPYQHSGRLKAVGTRGYIGIGNLPTDKKATPKQRLKLVEPTITQLRADGQIRTPDRTAIGGRGSMRPGLLITEFGFLNQPRNACQLDTTSEDACGAKPRPSEAARRNNNWHTDAVRAERYYTALTLAREAHAAWFLFYNVAEVPPEAYIRPGLPNGRNPEKRQPEAGPLDEFGLFKNDGTVIGCPSDGEDPNDPTCRTYGKDPRPPIDLTRFNHHQARKAYCAIWRWAKRRQYHANEHCGVP